jgi:predicted nucleic acid-binding protein
MSVLVDTNVLLRRLQPDHEHHALAIDSVAHLLSTGQHVYFTLQNISEFWNVMTRPVRANGLGFSPAFALGEVEKIETVLTLSCRIPPQLMRNGNVSSPLMPSVAPRCMTPGWWRL